MSKRKPPSIGRCVHCLADNISRNWDHVFPESWYPDSTPENTSKWIIPSCYKCNKEYGKLEQDLMIKLACCIDPQIAEASGIASKALRSLSAIAGKNLQDASHREAKRVKLLEQFLHGHEIPQSGIYPGLGERWGREKSKQTALLVPAKSIEKLCEKIVRGIYFIQDGKFIERPYKIKFYALAKTDEFNMLLEKFGHKYESGPGISVKRAITPEDGTSGLVSILIWGTFKMFAIISADEENS